MKSIEEILEPLWDYVPDQLIAAIDDELEDHVKEVVNNTLREAEKRIEEEKEFKHNYFINGLEVAKGVVSSLQIKEK